MGRMPCGLGQGRKAAAAACVYSGLCSAFHFTFSNVNEKIVSVNKAVPDFNTPYIALARKYRSSYFGELIGQDTLVKTLSNAIENNRVHHAYMFTGIRGTGKTSTARIIAKALNYTGPDGKGKPTIGPTDDCPVCQAIAQDRHPDVIELDAASHTGVDDMRELIDGVRYAPVSARYKIYIIDEVHMLSKAAFNALLKTLEEPPENTVFMFATTEIRKVPVTILSRCQRFDLRRVDHKTLVDHYRTISEKEGLVIEDEALNLIARAADGSVRDGLSLLDQAMSRAPDNKITADMIGTMLGQADRSMIIELFEMMLSGQAQESLKILSDLHKASAEAKIILDDLLNFTHFLTRVKMVPNLLESESFTSLEKEKGRNFSDTLSVPVLTRVWQILLKGVTELQIAPQPNKALEMIIIRVVYSAEHPPLHKILAQQEKLVSSPMAEKKTLTPEVSQKKPVSDSTKSSLKPKKQVPTLVEDKNTQKTTISIASLQDIVNLCHENGEVLLGSEIYAKIRLIELKSKRIEFARSSTMAKDLPQRLRKKLVEWTGDEWFIVVSSEKQGQPTLSEQKAEKYREELAEVSNHPIIKKMVKELPAFEIETITHLEKES